MHFSGDPIALRNRGQLCMPRSPLAQLGIMLACASHGSTNSYGDDVGQQHHNGGNDLGLDCCGSLRQQIFAGKLIIHQRVKSQRRCPCHCNGEAEQRTVAGRYRVQGKPNANANIARRGGHGNVEQFKNGHDDQYGERLVTAKHEYCCCGEHQDGINTQISVAEGGAHQGAGTGQQVEQDHHHIHNAWVVVEVLPQSSSAAGRKLLGPPLRGR